jgi:hypothetical protein
MKTNLKQRGLKLALASAFVLGATAGGQAFAVTGQATTSADVAAPIKITLTTGTALDFGAFLPAATAGTLTVYTDGTRDPAPTGGVALVTSPTDAAEFLVEGAPDAGFSITVAASTLTGPGTAMTLAPKWDVTTGAAVGTNPASSTLSSTGAKTIYVGGTLSVGASQVAGAYSGTVDVTVEYN